MGIHDGSPVGGGGGFASQDVKIENTDQVSKANTSRV